MGMDSVEILMKVENAFGIRIPDNEAEQIVTVGDFHNAVWKQLTPKHTNKCHSQILFYRLRTSIAETYIIPKQTIVLDSLLTDLFPTNNRRKSYHQFGNSNKLQLPQLVLPSSLSTVLTSFGVTAVLGTLIASIVLVNFFDYTKWFFLSPVCGILLTILLSEILNPKRTAFQPRTLKEFTKNTLALNYASLIQGEGTNRQEVESVINYIIADMAGFGIDEITADKRIGDDLGID